MGMSDGKKDESEGSCNVAQVRVTPTDCCRRGKSGVQLTQIAEGTLRW